jgi:NADPH:quinone reductase
MRGYAIDEFGQVGSIRELPEPVPGEGEVLVRVKAAGLNQTDCAVCAGMLKDWMEHRFPLVPGIDCSGVIERVGPGVDGYREGDEVVGFVRRPVAGEGTLAEFVALPVGGIQHKPESLTDEQASVIGHSSLTAVAAVEAAAPREGETVVILGATGGVGSYATQFVSWTGAHVIAVTRGDHADYGRSLGAVEVIDYTATDPVEAVRSAHPDGIDALIDLAGIPDLLAGFADLVRSGGRVVSVVIPPDTEGLAARGIEGKLATRWTVEDRFPEMVAGIADGRIKMPEIQTFSFEDAAGALELQATRHVRGKLAVVLDHGAPSTATRDERGPRS